MSYSISKAEWFYIVKCVLGAALCYLLYVWFPKWPFFWSIISVVLVISVENDSKLPYTRIKANLVGSGVGLALFFIPIPLMLSMCVGVVLSIMVGLWLKLGVSVRTALAAMLIVLMEEKQGNSWTVAFERVGCVAVGCFVGLLVTLAFTDIERKVLGKK